MSSMPDIEPQPAPPSPVPRLRHRHVIIAGFGVVGRMVADQFEDAGVDVTVVDLNPRTIEQQRRLKRTMIHGDVCDVAILREAGIERADALIIAVPDEDRAIRACQVARQLHPDLFIAARANFVSRGMLAAQAGADCVVVEEVVTAQAMQQAVMQRLLGTSSETLNNHAGPLAAFPRADHTGKPPR